MKALLVLGLSLAAAGASAVDTTHHRYWRALPDEVATGNVAFEPDGTMLAHARRDLGDVRIVDANGEQVPWRRLEPRQVAPEPAQVLNAGRIGDDAVALVDVGQRREPYERVDLDVEGEDFVGRVTVRGADSRAGPFVELSTTTVFDVQGATHARSTTVVLPATDYRFLELRASGVVAIRGATVLGQYERPQLVRRRHAIVAGDPDRGRESVYTLDFGLNGVPVSRLEVDAATERYDRPIRVESSRDGEHWVSLAAGRITRDEDVAENALEFGSEARLLRVTIENGDDPPLEDVRLETFGRSRAIVVEAGHPTPLRVYYGNPRLAPPSYEFARLAAERPERVLDPSQLAPEQVNEAYVAPPVPFLERHDWVVEAALVAAALALGAIGLLVLLRSRAG